MPQIVCLSYENRYNNEMELEFKEPVGGGFAPVPPSPETRGRAVLLSLEDI